MAELTLRHFLNPAPPSLITHSTVDIQAASTRPLEPPAVMASVLDKGAPASTASTTPLDPCVARTCSILRLVRFQPRI